MFPAPGSGLIFPDVVINSSLDWDSQVEVRACVDVGDPGMSRKVPPCLGCWTSLCIEHERDEAQGTCPVHLSVPVALHANILPQVEVGIFMLCITKTQRS